MLLNVFKKHNTLHVARLHINPKSHINGIFRPSYGHTLSTLMYYLPISIH